MRCSARAGIPAARSAGPPAGLHSGGQASSVEGSDLTAFINEGFEIEGTYSFSGTVMLPPIRNPSAVDERRRRLAPHNQDAHSIDRPRLILLRAAAAPSSATTGSLEEAQAFRHDKANDEHCDHT